jgi:hypothetical protein
MLDFVPRLRKKASQSIRNTESWLPIGNRPGSRAGTPRPDSRTSGRTESRTSMRVESRTSGRTESRSGARVDHRRDRATSTMEVEGDDARVDARVDGPPNFLDPHAASPPPTYAQVRNISRPEIANLIPTGRHSYGRPGIFMNATPRSSLPPLLTSSLTNLEDIRHGEVAHHIHMDNRLSSVPQYPVFLDPITRRRQLERPDSIASTSTEKVLLAVGQLPGSEPFETNARQAPGNRSDWRRSSQVPPASGRPQTGPSASQSGSLGRAYTVPRSAPRPPRAVNATSWLLDDSTTPSRASRERLESAAHEFYTPHRLSSTGQIKSNQYRRDSHREYSPHVRFAEDNSEPTPPPPPPPPPKDPGYRPATGVRDGRGRHNASSRSLAIVPSLRNSKGRESLTSEKTQRGDEWHHRRRRRGTESEKLSGTRKATNKGSQFVNACARFISRSIPRLGSSS